MEPENIPLFDDLPIDNPDALKKERGPTVFQENLLYLMDRDKVELMDIHRATGVSVTTLWDWMAGNVEAPMASESLLKLARYFNVGLNFILFDEGDDSPFYTDLKSEGA